MRIVAALGGNALLRRGEHPKASVQVSHVREAVRGLADLAVGNDLVVTHGNGPQIGLLAVESAADPALSTPYPLDALGAQTQGVIGYWLARELRRHLPGREVVALLTETVVDPRDPAFARPTKFVGRAYPAPDAGRLHAEHGWTMRRDGDFWRRAVPSPEPSGIVELPTITRLVEDGCLVVAVGGDGVPTGPDHRGVEAVVDKDLASALLAAHLKADMLLLLTDVPAVMRGHGTAAARPVREATPAALRDMRLPDGSMGPKAEAACRFAESRPGAVAAIGSLTEATALLAGAAGTRVEAP
ncbi:MULTISPECIES: carbamate kinase [Actinomadura]|uniref:Carbamate kinase n=1 Tax=Actinomadura litoris TaxID=2678616 RepID=A0A7K1L5X7_9ACTN|nr:MULTISPECIES: carbamate kinase [Actinomadura]MBT2212690.1 carbamate kinase [Actinomadura sp. NEAU-AAG7]MUN39666.1 carbamate kinase [Actinomadura litoris]